MPLGRYWRSSPLVFSLLPRCHGECGSQKYTWMPVCSVNRCVRGQLAALVPGQTLDQMRRQLPDPFGQHVDDVLRVWSSKRASITYRVCRSTNVTTAERFARSDQQIPFPMARHPPVICLRRPLSDRDHLRDPSTQLQ